MKVKTFVYKVELQVIDYQSVKDGKARMMEVTPRESIANYLANCPSSFVDSLWDYILDSVEFSVAMGESRQQMKDRIHCDVMKLTTEYKNQFGE